MVIAMPDGSFLSKEVVHPASETGEIVFFEDIVATVPECRAAAYENAQTAIRKWKEARPERYRVPPIATTSSSATNQPEA